MLCLQVAESMGFKGDFRQWEDLLRMEIEIFAILRMSWAVPIGGCLASSFRMGQVTDHSSTLGCAPIRCGTFITGRAFCE